MDGIRGEVLYPASIVGVNVPRIKVERSVVFYSILPLKMDNSMVRTIDYLCHFLEIQSMYCVGNHVIVWVSHKGGIVDH